MIPLLDETVRQNAPSLCWVDAKRIPGANGIAITTFNERRGNEFTNGTTTYPLLSRVAGSRDSLRFENGATKRGLWSTQTFDFSGVSKIDVLTVCSLDAVLVAGIVYELTANGFATPGGCARDQVNGARHDAYLCGNVGTNLQAPTGGGDTAYPTGTWMMLADTYDTAQPAATEVVCRFNGAPKSTTLAAAPNNKDNAGSLFANAKIAIGCRAGTATLPILGNVAECIWVRGGSANLALLEDELRRSWGI